MPWTPTSNVSAGSVLTATSYNEQVLGNVNELRNTHSSLSAQDTTTQTGGASADFTYTTCEITLTPGTWLVQGGASLINTQTTDSSAVSLWNQTTGAEVTNSSGPGGFTLTAYNNVLTSRLVEITVTANTAIRVRCKRAGGSTIRATSVAGAPAACLNAYRVRT